MLFRRSIRQRADVVYQEPHQRNSVLCTHFRIGVAVRILQLCIVQCHCAVCRLVQQDRIFQVYNAVQIDITQNGQFDSCVVVTAGVVVVSIIMPLL